VRGYPVDRVGVAAGMLGGRRVRSVSGGGRYHLGVGHASSEDDGGRERVLITGMGAVSPVGVGVGAYIAAVREARSGVRAFDPGDRRCRSRVAATVGMEGGIDGFEPRGVLEDADLRRLPRLVPMALAAAGEALEMARWQRAKEPYEEEERERARRIGVVLGTGGGGIDFTLDQMHAGFAGRPASLWTITNATHGNLAGEVSIRLGLRGPSWCISTGCASASDAVGIALERLRAQGRRGGEGELDAMVVVGADAHVRWETLSSMELLRVITVRDWAAMGEDPRTASRPFDRTRDGFVLGEGAWAVVLERERSVRRREAWGCVLGEVMGYGATCDAYHRVRPSPDMEESARAMRMAVADAGLEVEQVEVVHYHGTSTKLNDTSETAAVKLAFGETHARRLVGHSVKAIIGHPQGACGLASLVATVGAMAGVDGRGGFLPPTAHLREPDPQCDLDYTPLVAREVGKKRIALINCLAFGAKNSALVVRVSDADDKTSAAPGV